MRTLGVCKRTKLVLKETWEGMQLKELYSTILFRAILGCIVPKFKTYFYYYAIDVAGFTQWQYSQL